jgi:ketosteroid isomerase-like protein
MTNVDRLRQAYQAWHDSRGADRAAWLGLLADDAAVRSLADGAPGMEFAGPRRGRAAVEKYLSEITRDWEMLFFAMDEFIVDGDRVVAVGRCGWRHKGTGKAVESPAVHLWRFRDGRATELVEFYDTAKASAAARPD